MKIVHIIHNDKFTAGYINFMKLIMTEWEHYFYTFNTNILPQLVSDENVQILNANVHRVKDRDVEARLEEADKIIISGVFRANRMRIYFSDEILDKVYLHFWGGDLYALRKKFSLYRLKRFSAEICKWTYIKKCRAIITLIEEDYKEFQRSCKMDKKHFVAPMPFNPCTRLEYYKYYKKERKSGNLRIVIGNSATKENEHLEVFETLRNMRDVEVYCPLSYGSDRYKKFIIEKGNAIFGKRFHPITEFMSLDKYCELLSTFDVGIFNNNRQQGMGNIIILLGMGKKVYLRKNTSMWSNFVEQDLKVFNVDDIREIDEENLNAMLEMDRENNVDIIKKWQDVEWKINAWKQVFED